MRVPTIHLNGTSKERLLDQLTDAGLALSRALDELSEATPNGRDYYPQGATAFAEAMGEHKARVYKLREVYNELSALTEAIADKGAK